MSEELAIRYETATGVVELNRQIVDSYIKRGNANLTDQEVKSFIDMCRIQKLNPFINEAYLIKYGNSPAQNVVGYHAYVRRACEHPDYRGKTSGIFVQRGENLVRKEGSAVYPGERLLSGWCEAKRESNGKEFREYKEVSFDEYNTNQSNWKTKPGMMIEKVAISQCLRALFPRDLTGLYTAEELPAQEEPQNSSPINVTNSHQRTVPPKDDQKDDPNLVTKEQRNELFDMAIVAFGAEKATEQLKQLCKDFGFDGTKNLTKDAYAQIMAVINATIDGMNESE